MRGMSSPVDGIGLKSMERLRLNSANCGGVSGSAVCFYPLPIEATLLMTPYSGADR